MKWKICIFAVIFLSAAKVYSQQGKIKFSYLSVSQGLSQSSVFAITQDKYGYIWIGTFDGLNRYDGYQIENFKNSYDDSLSLQDNYVQSLFTDKSGQLWVGTNSSGLCLFDYVSEHFIPVCRNALKGSSILTISEFNDSSIVVLTEAGINQVNIRTKEVKYLSNKEYRESGKNSSLISYFNPEKKDDQVLTCYCKDSKGDIWKGTTDGLFRKAYNENVWLHYSKNAYETNSLSANEITCIYEDCGGVIWIGTSLGGVCKWDRLYEEISLFRGNPDEKDGLSSNKIRCFYEDSENRIWIGTVENGLNCWNREKGCFKYWNTKDGSGLRNDHIRDLTEWQGQYIVATDGGGIQRFFPDTSHLIFEDLKIKELPYDARIWDLFPTDTSLWIAGYGHGLCEIKQGRFISYSDKIPEKKCTWVTSDADGNLWVGTFGGGCYIKRPYSNRFEHISRKNSDLSDNRVYSIVPDSTGNVWIATKGGLNCYDSETGKITVYGIADGLPNSTVMGIVPDTDKSLWLTTNYGICHFYPGKRKAENYDINDGLQSYEFLVHSFLPLKSGEMLLGGIDGFNVFPAKLPEPNRYKPRVVITDFLVGQESWVTDSAIMSKKIIELSYDRNEFTFEFAALSFADPGSNKYAYMLKGFDRDWKNSNTRRFAQYTNVSHGKYVFYVKASNNDGVWNETPYSISLIVRPAFWQTIFFKIMVLLSIITMIICIYKIRMQRVKKLNIRLEEEVQIRTKEVVEQKKEIEEKNETIEFAFNNIQDSIKYAQRIQNAVLPQDKEIKKYLKNSFVLYFPKDIVAGDFYWVQNINSKIMFAVGDCTGHGVPGAMVSVVCNNALNRAVKEYELTDAGAILDKTKEIIVQEFAKSDEEVNDGMDISFCVLDGLKLQYAGAYNPLWIIRDGKLLETKADKQPIGKFTVDRSFITHNIDLQKGDTLYLFSDGFADQFGGEKGKKFKTGAMKKMFVEIQNFSLEEQKSKIDETFRSWKGDLEQVDDVCILGVRV